MIEEDPAGGAYAVELFDLDGVLSRADTMGHVVWLLLRERPRRAGAVLLPAVLSLVMPVRSSLRPRLHRAIVSAALAGLSDGEFEHVARGAAIELAHRVGNVPREAVRVLRAARLRSRVVVVTGSETRLAKWFLAEVGMCDIEVQGSQIAAGNDGRLRLVQHNVAPAKVASCRAAGVDVKSARLYTDSLSDLPLGVEAAHVVLVNPTTAQSRSMRARVSALSGGAVVRPSDV